MNVAALLFGQLGYLMSFFASQFMQNDLNAVLQNSNHESAYGLPQAEVFDFIIVGGGTAGCLLANKLSRASYRVLLLETGGDPAPQGEIPFFAPNYVPVNEYMYNYPSVPMSNASQETGGIANAWSGKLMGGTSSVNYGVFNRGHPLDFDNWANLTGDSSWNYENMLPYFRAIETYMGEFPSTDAHGFNGSLVVSSQAYAPGARVWYEAGAELGYESNTDPNGPQTAGFMPIEYTKENGRRVSAYTAYIRNQSLANLDLRRYSNVEEILFNEDNNTVTAYGVRYVQHGFPKVAIASREVILSAGTFGTPQILLRSGIGPADELAKSNIRTVVNLPGVGKNLQEHASMRMQFSLNTSDPSIVYVPERDLTYDVIDQFLNNGSGLLTLSASTAAQGFIPSSLAIAEGYPTWSDIKYTLASTDAGGRAPGSNDTGLTYIGVNVFIARPKSTGYVRLNPNDTNGLPLIDYGLLTDPRDTQIYLDGIRTALRLFEETNAYRRIGGAYPNTPLPECASEVFRSDAYWRCYMRQRVNACCHPAGTSAMGRNASEGAVVDSQLRVHGVSNLRVIDASIMPKITNANLQASVYAIADKISDQILNDLNAAKSKAHRHRA